LARLLGQEVNADDVRNHLVRRFADVFERDVSEHGVETRSVQVWLWRRGGAGHEVLLLKRSERDGGFWQPVTGLVELGEEPADAARREVREETGVSGQPRDLDYVRDFVIEPVGASAGPRGPRPWLDREFAFEMETNEPDIRLSEGEHDGYLWTTTERAKELLRWKGNQRALARLAHRWGETSRSS
jgi:8-oxo-dGTP pyrophosphatase MutT (NUDIX family)